MQALTAGADGASRAKMARLGEWLKVGGGIPGCMHGGGSPDGAKLVVRAMTKWEGLRRRIPPVLFSYSLQ